MPHNLSIDLTKIFEVKNGRKKEKAKTKTT
jgi:hypothetical protein